MPSKTIANDRLTHLHACSVSTLRIFAAVVECRSFSGAAHRMQLAPSTVSKHIESLESILDIPLVHRTTRQVSINDAGLLLYERVRVILAELEDAVHALTSKAVTIEGRLSITAPPSFASTVILPRLPDFLRRHPKLSVEIQTTSRVVDVVREGVDVAILYEDQVNSKITSIRIAPDRRVFCASPEYIDRHGEPLKPEDLVHHRCLINIYSSREGAWPFEVGSSVRFLGVEGEFAANDGDMLRAVCVAGVGIGFFHLFHVNEYLKSGQLREVLRGFQAAPSSILAAIPHRRPVAPKVRAFLDYINDSVRALSYEVNQAR